MRRTLVTLGVFLLGIAISASAEQPGQWASELTAICSEYGIMDVDTVPSGITPLEIASIGELKRFLSGVEGVFRSKFQHASDTLLAGEVTNRSLIETWVETHERICLNPLIRTYFNLWGEIWIAGSGSFWQITDAYEWVGLTGATYYVSLSNSWHHTVISSDRQIATIRGGGILDYYLVFESALKLYSVPISLTDRFRLYGS